jgi:hypothetical protein
MIEEDIDLEEPESDVDSFIADVVFADNNTFSFSLIYENSKVKYEGTFVCKVPSIHDMITIGKNTALEFQGVSQMAGIPTEIYNMAYHFATLKVVLVKYPDWFKLNELVDIRLLEVIYGKYIIAVERFRDETFIRPSK